MSASLLVRSARRSRHLTQGQLAQRVKITQPRISRVENDLQRPTFDTVERLLAGTGHRLISVPTTRADAVIIAAEIRLALEVRRPERAVRLFIQLNDNLFAEHGAVRLALALGEPEKTGVKHWDAALGALVAYRLSEESLPLPQWVNSSGRTLVRPWVFGAGSYTLRPETTQVPQEFLQRGVLIHRDALASL